MRRILSAMAVLAITGAGTAPLAASASPVYTVTAAATVAQQSADEREERRRARQTLSSSVAKVLGEAFEKINLEPPQYQEAMNSLNRLAARDNLSGYDRSTVLEIRGGVYAALENYPASLRDYVAVLNLDALPYPRLRQIRFNVAQLYYQEDNFDQAIRFMEEYLNGVGGDVEDGNAWFILAASYIAKDDYRSARKPAENALRYDKKQQKKSYDLLNLVYSELGADRERGTLLEQMIERFPNEVSYWAQLSGVYSLADRALDAFATLEAAYKAGLIRDEPKIIALAQYYASLENPFRGAKLIDAEMATGAVRKNLRNLELLSQLWSMSYEQKKAIEALKAAAAISPSGQLYYRLGQSYMGDEQYQSAVRYLRLAREKGGLNERARGDIQLLLGAALYNLDSNTTAGRNRAKAEYRRGTQYRTSRQTAQGWMSYIDAVEQTYRDQLALEKIQREERRRQEIKRCNSLIDVFELGGNVDKTRLDQCRVVLAEDEAGVDATEDAVSDTPEATEENADAPAEAG